MPKTIQITVQLHSFHTLARLCSKFFKLGFKSLCTKNFQMYKMDLEKRNQRSNCQHMLDYRKSKGIPKKKKSSSASLTILKPLTVWITTNCGKFLKRRDYQTTTSLLRNMSTGQEATSQNLKWNKGLVIRKGVHQGCILLPYLFNFNAEYIM